MTLSNRTPVRLTLEQALSLAPDRHALRSARSTASVVKWRTLGRAPASIWGEFALKDERVYQVAIMLPAQRLSCSCNSRKRPCTHLLGLNLLWTLQPDVFTRRKAPDWLQSFASNPYAPTRNAPQSASAAQARYSAIMAGLAELEKWLQDMVRYGLARVPERPKTYWKQMADRLVDAQLREIAREVRTLEGIPATGDAWPQRLLQKLSRLHLLIEGFKRYHTLSPRQQGDLRLAVGWLSPQDSSETITDEWHVLGSYQRPDGRRSVQHLWLVGAETGRTAHYQHVLHSRRQEWLGLVVGAAYTGSITFYASTASRRAMQPDLSEMRQPLAPLDGSASLHQIVDAFCALLVRNPWVRHYPAVLQNVRTQRVGERWRLIDGAGQQLPLPAGFDCGWHLSALGTDDCSRIFGLWDGSEFTPFSVWSSNRWLDLRILKAIK